MENKLEVLLIKVFTQNFPINLWILTLFISPILFMLFNDVIISKGSSIHDILLVYFFIFIFSLFTSIPSLIVFYLIYTFLVERVSVWWLSFTAIAFPLFGATATLYLLDVLWPDFLPFYVFGLLLRNV